MVKRKYLVTGCLLLQIALVTGGAVALAETPDPGVFPIGQEVRYLLVIDEVIAPGLFPSLYGAFNQSQALWPVALPSDLSSSYTGEFRFLVTGCPDSGNQLCYGDVYRGDELLYHDQPSLLVIHPEVYETRNDLYYLAVDTFRNLTWRHAIYTDHDGERVTRITLSFTSPADAENQVWSGWFIWSYDSSGIAERFEIIVWRMNNNLVTDYDPLTNPDKSDLTAYYEIVFQTPGVVNETLGFMFIFMGGIASFMISPFVLLAFILRTPAKQYTGMDRLPLEEHTTVFWKSGIGYIKLIAGSVIIAALALFQFVFPSSAATTLVAILFTGFLWFGAYLLVKTSVEKVCGASVQIFPFLLVSIVSLVLGLWGLTELQGLIAVTANPGMVESVVFVAVLCYAMTLGASNGPVLIYEALYTSSWSHDLAAKAFIIKRKHPLITTTEYIPGDYLEKVTVTTNQVKGRYGPVTTAILTLKANPPHKTREKKWTLRNKQSYLNLFAAVDYMLKQGLLSEQDTSAAVEAVTGIQPGLFQSQLRDEERRKRLEEKYPELARKQPDQRDLEEELRAAGAEITHKGSDDISIVFPDYRTVALKGPVMNLVVVAITAVVMTGFTLRLLEAAYTLGFSGMNQAGVFIGVTMAVLTVMMIVLTARYLKRLPEALSKQPLSLHLAPGELIIERENVTERYPIALLARAMVKRDLFAGAVFCLGKEHNRLPLLYLSERKVAGTLASYISNHARQVNK